MQNASAKSLLNGISVIAQLAALGYISGVVQGQGNEFLLAGCGAALGAFVVLLGYGPVVLMTAALRSLAGWSCRKRGKM